jgi:hypothetical protein
MTDHSPRPALIERLWSGCGLGLLLGVPAAFGDIVLVGRAWAACDVGLNAGTKFFSLMFFVFPVMACVNSVVLAVVFAVAGGGRAQRGWWGWVGAAAVGLLALAMVTWLLMATEGTPSDYPSPWCERNVPPWWPSWIPV